MKDLSLYCLITLVTCATPGAGVLYTVTSALRYGKRCAFCAPLGNSLGCLIMSVISAAGVGTVISQSPLLYAAMQSLGAVVLLYLGVKSFRVAAMDLTCAGGVASTAHEESPMRILFGSTLLQVTNPMLIVFLLSLLPQFIGTDADYVSRISILIALFIGICFSVHCTYSWLMVFGARFMNRTFSFWLNKISGVLFFLLGLSVLVRSLEPMAERFF